MPIDSLLVGKLDRFNYNLAMLHQTVEMTKPVLEGMKTAMAVQWFLGNIFLIVLFAASVVLLIHHYKKMKKLQPGFRIPKKLFVIYSVAFVLFMAAFNILPQMGMEQAQITTGKLNEQGR